MEINLTLQQIIWEEVRNYRLAQKAQQLNEAGGFVQVGSSSSSSSSSSNKSNTNKSNTNKSNSANKAVNAAKQTPKPAKPKSNSPFKSQEEASNFYRWAREEVGGPQFANAKSSPTDPVLIDLYYQYKTEYLDDSKTNQRLQSGRVNNQSNKSGTDDASSDDGSTTSQGALWGFTYKEWAYAIIGLVSIGLLWIAKRLIFRKAPAAGAGLSKVEIDAMINQAVNNMQPQEFVAIVKNRNWFTERLTNFLRINRREFNRAAKEMDVNANAISDENIIQIGEALGKTFINRAAYIAAKEKMLKFVVNSLNAGKLPRGMKLSEFLNWLSPAERAKYGAKLQQRWEHVARIRNRKAVSKKIYNKGKKKIQRK